MNIQKSGVSTTAIALLIIGLVVGAGSGYFLVSRSFEQKIKEMEEVMTTYETNMSDLETEITAFEQKIKDHEATEASMLNVITTFETRIAEMEAERAELEQQLNDYNATAAATEHMLITYETRVSELQTEKSNLEEQVLALEAKIEELQVSGVPNSYSIFNITFKYPDGWFIYPFGLEAEAVTEEYGILVVGSADRRDSFYVFWGSVEEGYDFDLDDGFEFISFYIEDIERGTVVNSTKDGHYLIYQDYTLTEYGGVNTYGAIAVWRCDDSGREFLIIYRTLGEYKLSTFLNFLDSFECH